MAIVVSIEPCLAERYHIPMARRHAVHIMDGSKELTADFRHRALRHHAEGIFAAERHFGVTIVLATGRIVPVRLIAGQHVLEDLGRIPSFADWVRCIRPEPWMGRRSEIAGITDTGTPAPT